MLQRVAPGTRQRTSVPGVAEMVGSCACAFEAGAGRKQASASVARTVSRIGLTIMKSPWYGLFDGMDSYCARIGKPGKPIFELRFAATMFAKRIQTVEKLNRARLEFSVPNGTFAVCVRFICECQGAFLTACAKCRNW